MRPRSSPLPTALLLATAWIAGCQSTVDRSEQAGEPTRDVQLVEPALPAAVGISDLEAGRPLVAAPKPRAPRPAPAPQAAPPVESSVTEELAPTLSTTMAAEVELAPAPASGGPSADEDVVVLTARPIQPTYAINVNPPLDPDHGRGPVIIRGGRGGIHDDCDLHRPGVRRIPAAIYRSGIR